MNHSLKKDILAYGRSLGFERVGVAAAHPRERDDAFFRGWLAEGRAGEMAYLEREPEVRARPERILPNARSVIVCAAAYAVDAGPEDGRIARYARGPDYHKVLGKRLDSLVRYIHSMAPEADCRRFVDTGPLLERAFAQQSGLGFVGKNTMLITRGLGSWVFLASVVTTLDLPPDGPDDRSCGECRICMDACPTEAITRPFDLDPRRCIAYWTIESRKGIPEDSRRRMGAWVFGCDICQEVCPHNRPSLKRRGPLSGNPLFMDPRQGLSLRTNLAEILSLSNDREFRDAFAGTPVLRAGREGLLRNACVAAANLARHDLSDRLRTIAESDSSPIVREHAAWAFETLAGTRRPPAPKR